MIMKMELNDAGEIVHVYYIRGNPGEETLDPHAPNSGLVIDESEEDMFSKFLTHHDLYRRIYRYENGKFEKRVESTELNLDIAEWFDNQPIVLPKEYNELPGGVVKKDRIMVDDLTPEELNVIVEPVPVISDFPEITKSFVKTDKYKEVHNIDFIQKVIIDQKE